MHKHLFTLLLALLATLSAWGQTLRVEPNLSAPSGTYDDALTVTCTFPEGCEGGKYWINGGELQARAYDGPISIDYSCALSVAGTDAAGRIITDVVTRQYDIRRVTPPTLEPQPEEGVRTTSFYVTRLHWSHVTTAGLDLSAYKQGGEHHGEYVVWLTGPDGSLISGGDSNNLWADGLNTFKAYVYKSYAPEEQGEYVLHIAPGVFLLDGVRYDKAIELHYLVTDGSAAPVFSPAAGEYKGSVAVTIDYPTDGSAFYRFYKLNGAKAKQYTAPITLTETTTIEAYGMDEAFSAATPSTTATYTILPADPTPEVLSAPTITREGGTVSISGPAGATLKYWFRDRMATAQVYTAPFTVGENGRISCVAYTESGVSPTVSIDVTGFDPDRGDRGEQVLITPSVSETAHLCALSPNGRWAVGYVGSDTSSKGFVWDLEADALQYASTIFVNQLWDVRDDGTAFGWRARSTDIDESMSESDLLWGSFKDGVWTEMSRDAFLAGSLPAPPAGYPAATAVSASGEWAILGQEYRYNTRSGAVERLVSMSDRFAGGGRPEVLSCIADDGTIFGTYDPTYLSPEKGTGLVRTTDGRWRDVAEWLRDTMGLNLLDSYSLSSVRGVSGDGHTLLFHATPRGLSSDDTFTRGLLLRIDVPVRHLAPVGVKAEQMSGRSLVKLTWRAPLSGADDVTAYTVWRSDKAEPLTTVGPDTFIYYDEAVEQGQTYTYSVKARYADGTESAESRQSSVGVSLNDHFPVRNLSSRRIGLNSLGLSWDAPIVALPKLQYFDEEAETFAFGTGSYNAEFGIRIPASDMATFEGQEVRTFQFLPTGPQKSYSLRLYRGSTGKGISYDDTPFYSQTIDPASLNYGTVNTIELTSPQSLPAGADLYVALYIESLGTSNMLGISYEGFRSGYTDLCRVEGVHSKMVAMSQNSSEVTEVVLPLGIGVASEADYNANIIDTYAIDVDGQRAATTASTRHTLEQLAEGAHTVSVRAVYRDGQPSAAATLSLSMTDNAEAYTAVTPRIDINTDSSATLTWEAPRDDDRSLIHWGNLTPSAGWPLAKNLTGFMAISIYPVTLTADYAADYEISEIFFCPTAEGVDYELAIGDEEGNILSYVAPEDLRIGELNYVSLPQPLPINASTTYQVVVNVPQVAEGVAALAYDASGKWQNGFSNVLNYGDGLTTLAELVGADERPNWLMGMVVRQKNARPLPVEGYLVSIDGARQNASPLAATTFTTAPLGKGRHTAAVDVVYTAGHTATGSAASFTIDPEGIDTPLADNASAAATTYDLQGRRVISDRQGRGLYIISNRKVTR